MVGKLFTDLGPRYQDRPGGYIRIMKCGFRTGDNAPMAYVELVDRPQVDVFEDEQLRKDIRAEWVERVGDYKYAPIVPEGPPPVPDHVTGAGEN